ncbi:MAG TPA: type II toxin-antitoxin system VapC family toxin [Stellaceae bacterium]|jgi:ribonuclease VapC|nr:type II toxin-antitoxin system VapC family toxin [Stellaceae bacterium]
MIAVDTSALMAISLDEPAGTACEAALTAEDEIVISAGTLAEVLIVSARRRVGAKMADIVNRLDFTIVPVTAAAARQIGQAYERWGRGMHPAALNFGDCFAYAVAKEHGCRLLYVGDDFAKTDIEAVL